MPAAPGRAGGAEAGCISSCPARVPRRRQAAAASSGCAGWPEPTGMPGGGYARRSASSARRAQPRAHVAGTLAVPTRHSADATSSPARSPDQRGLRHDKGSAASLATPMTSDRGARRCASVAACEEASSHGSLPGNVTRADAPLPACSHGKPEGKGCSSSGVGHVAFENSRGTKRGQHQAARTGASA